jgi:hypothetical protein
MRWTRELAFWTLTTAVVGLGVLLVLVMSGQLVAQPTRPTIEAAPPATTEPPPTTSAPTIEPESETEPAPAPEPEPANGRPTDPQTVAVTISASRGDCWVSARKNAETGDVLFEGILPLGESIQVEGVRVWLLLGASANVDVSVDGKDVSLPAGTVETVMPLPKQSS